LREQRPRSRARRVDPQTSLELRDRAGVVTERPQRLRLQ
jgi:hypothetical protein